MSQGISTGLENVDKEEEEEGKQGTHVTTTRVYRDSIGSGRATWNAAVAVRAKHTAK